MALSKSTVLYVDRFRSVVRHRLERNLGRSQSHLRAELTADSELMRRDRLAYHLWLGFGRRAEKQGQCYGRSQRCPQRNKEQTVEVSDTILSEHLLDEKRADGIGRERADPEDHDVEQTLGAGAGILRKIIVHENINGG